VTVIGIAALEATSPTEVSLDTGRGWGHPERAGFGSGVGIPPSGEQVWKLIRCVRELASPSFAAWLQVAAFTDLRLGELDALRRTNFDLDRGRIRVVEQFNAKTLVRKLYGHRDRERALDRVTAAYERTASFTQMRLV
jgi:hypothetical protein